MIILILYNIYTLQNYTFSVDPEWNSFKKKFEKLGFFNVNFQSILSILSI